jgi:hypothetical protein
VLRAIVGIGVATAVCLAGLGCGGGGESSPLTKAEFIKQADAICAKVNKENTSEVAAYKKQHSITLRSGEAAVDEIFENVVVPSIRRQVEQLEALSPPAEDEEKIAKMIGHLSQAAESLAEKGFEGLGGSGFAPFQQEAVEYGLEDCHGLIY